jgi:hypothetical protein
MGTEENVSVFVTAHEASRLSKAADLEPIKFLTHYPADFDSNIPSFQIKGKEHILGIDNKYENLKFRVGKPISKELEEYKKIVEIWNRNFGEKGSFIDFLNFTLNRVKL